MIKETLVWWYFITSIQICCKSPPISGLFNYSYILEICYWLTQTDKKTKPLSSQWFNQGNLNSFADLQLQCNNTNSNRFITLGREPNSSRTLSLTSSVLRLSPVQGAVDHSECQPTSFSSFINHYTTDLLLDWDAVWIDGPRLRHRKDGVRLSGWKVERVWQQREEVLTSRKCGERAVNNKLAG